jgi:hypothetical protein
MFHWFQNLLPRQGNFFELFEAHGQTLIAGSNALARLLQGGPGMADHVREIAEREHDADAITREVLVTVRRTFLTPFDRGAITSLISAMDDSIDQMHQTSNAISLYEVTAFEQEMADMAAIIVECARDRRSAAAAALDPRQRRPPARADRAPGAPGRQGRRDSRCRPVQGVQGPRAERADAVLRRPRNLQPS